MMKSKIEKFFWMLRNLTTEQYLYFHKHRRRILSAYVSTYCDGVVLEIYLDAKFQWPQEGLDCESLAYKVQSSYLTHKHLLMA